MSHLTRNVHCSKFGYGLSYKGTGLSKQTLPLIKCHFYFHMIRIASILFLFAVSPKVYSPRWAIRFSYNSNVSNRFTIKALATISFAPLEIWKLKSRTTGFMGENPITHTALSHDLIMFTRFRTLTMAWDRRWLLPLNYQADGSVVIQRNWFLFSI